VLPTAALRPKKSSETDQVSWTKIKEYKFVNTILSMSLVFSEFICKEGQWFTTSHCYWFATFTNRSAKILHLGGWALSICLVDFLACRNKVGECFTRYSK